MDKTQNQAIKLYNKVVTKAKQHGEDSDPDHEVGDLQDSFRAAVGLMTMNQLKKLRSFLKKKEII